MLYRQPLAQLARGLRAREFSSLELTQLFLNRIKQYDEQINAFITVDEYNALQSAKRADELLASGKGGPLTGVPIAHKDIFCTKNCKTSAGSLMLDSYISPYDATMITRFNQAGAVSIGKTNMDQFAMGSSNETSFYGVCHNPWDLTRVPGGSSGGSAAAVAGRLAPAATGTDTGGSIRQPAALTGITGMKPTYGRVSRYGMIAFASSLDQAGPMTQTAEGAAMMLNIMAGYDEKDSTSVNKVVPDYTKTLNQPIKGLRIGLVKEHFVDLNPEISKIVMQATKVLEQQGAILSEVNLPHNSLAVPVYYVLAPAEASSNLARYDGVRYGYRCENPKDLADLYKRSRTEGFGDEVKQRIMIGTYVLSAGYYDAYYLKAQRVRRLIANDFAKSFENVDVLLGPGSPTTAFKIGEKINDAITMYLTDIYTVAVNLAGLPAMVFPAGFSHDNLPVGLQLIGNYFDEARLLNIAHLYQQQTDWHTRIAKIFN